MPSIVGRQYRRLREVETPLTRAAHVGYAQDNLLTGNIGSGYSWGDDTPRDRLPLEKTLAIGTPTPPLPGWMADVADLWPADSGEWGGAVCVARCRSTGEAWVADMLARERVSYYLPAETVTKEYRYPGRIKRVRYSRCLFPGLLVVGDGIRGNEAARLIGSRYANTVYGFITVSAATAAGFRQQLTNLALVLAHDPELRVHKGIIPGRRVRVASGPFMGAVGVLIEERQGHRFAVSLPLFGRTVDTEINVEHLEPADDDSPAA